MRAAAKSGRSHSPNTPMAMSSATPPTTQAKTLRSMRQSVLTWGRGIDAGSTGSTGASRSNPPGKRVQSELHQVAGLLLRLKGGDHRASDGNDRMAAALGARILCGRPEEEGLAAELY